MTFLPTSMRTQSYQKRLRDSHSQTCRPCCTDSPNPPLDLPLLRPQTAPTWHQVLFLATRKYTPATAQPLALSPLTNGRLSSVNTLPTANLENKATQIPLSTLSCSSNNFPVPFYSQFFRVNTISCTQFFPSLVPITIMLRPQCQNGAQ